MRPCIKLCVRDKPLSGKSLTLYTKWLKMRACNLYTIKPSSGEYLVGQYRSDQWKLSLWLASNIIGQENPNGKLLQQIHTGHASDACQQVPCQCQWSHCLRDHWPLLCIVNLYTFVEWLLVESPMHQIDFTTWICDWSLDFLGGTLNFYWPDGPLTSSNLLARRKIYWPRATGPP